VVGSPRSPRVWPPASGHPAGRGVAAEGREAAEVRAAGERDEWWLDSFAVFGLLGALGPPGAEVEVEQRRRSRRALLAL
jgi:hypothetical protein